MAYNGRQAVIYNNCANLGVSSLPMPNKVTRTTNFIGKTASVSDPNLYANAIYDDIKIYQGKIDVSKDCVSSGRVFGNIKNSCPTTTTSLYSIPGKYFSQKIIFIIFYFF